MVRVKICGITTVADARQAVSAGADALGLVFYTKSPRAVSVEQAAEIAKAAGPYVTVVGLFVNADVDYVQQVLSQVGVHVLQFHGDEDNEFCKQFNRPWYKAIRMHPALNSLAAMDLYPDACGFLFDAWSKHKYGGTGETFAWHRMPNSDKALVLAGGLNADNVTQAIAIAKPYAVDVSGGVESAPGDKDPQLVNDFIANAKNPLA
jgi:phosphoribosylanthranilate isomerase